MLGEFIKAQADSQPRALCEGFRWLLSTVASKLALETEVGMGAGAIATYSRTGEVEMLLGEQIVYYHFVLVGTSLGKVLLAIEYRKFLLERWGLRLTLTFPSEVVSTAGKNEGGEEMTTIDRVRKLGNGRTVFSTPYLGSIFYPKG